MGHLRLTRRYKNLKHYRIESQTIIGPIYLLREALTAKPENTKNQTNMTFFVGNWHDEILPDANIYVRHQSGDYREERWVEGHE